MGEGRSRNCDLGSPCHYVGDPSTRVVSATGSSIPAKRRRAWFWHGNGEGSTAGWAGGQNRGGRQNREEDGGSGTLTLTKSSSVRITGKPDKVGSASGSETEIMSSNVFSPIQTLGFGLKQISPKKDLLSNLLRAFEPLGWLQRTKAPVSLWQGTWWPQTESPDCNHQSLRIPFWTRHSGSYVHMLF
jgi:hypothetical protein